MRNVLRAFLPLKWQIRFNLLATVASVAPLAPILDSIRRRKGLRIIEIGSRYGDSLKWVASRYRVESYTAVDPYIDYRGYEGDGFDEVLRRSDEESIYQRTQQIGNQLLGSRFQLIRDFSHSAAQELVDGDYDFVFVDGNHRYPFVLDDLEDYWPKLSPGGFLCGHDFFMRHRNIGGNYPERMVFEAVTDFTKQHGLEFEVFGSHRGFPMCFAIRKP